MVCNIRAKLSSFLNRVTATFPSGVSDTRYRYLWVSPHFGAMSKYNPSICRPQHAILHHYLNYVRSEKSLLLVKLLTVTSNMLYRKQALQTCTARSPSADYLVFSFSTSKSTGSNELHCWMTFKDSIPKKSMNELHHALVLITIRLYWYCHLQDLSDLPIYICSWRGSGLLAKQALCQRLISNLNVLWYDHFSSVRCINIYITRKVW